MLGIDRFDPPHALGSSHGETRVTRKAYFEDPRYVPLLERSFLRYRTLEEEVGRPLFQPTLGLHFGPSTHDALRAVEAAAKQHGLAHQRLSADDVARRFAICPASGDVAVLEEEAGVLAAEPMVAAFLEVAQKYGATRLSGVRVIAIEAGDGDAVVRTDTEVFRAARVVLSTGAWSAEAALVPVPVPLTVERQVQLWFAPRDAAQFMPERFPIFIRFGEDAAFYGLPLVPRFGGLSARAVKVCAHHGGLLTTADALDRTVTSDDERQVREFVDVHLPQLGAIVESRVCMYTNTPDENFVIGPHPEIPRVILACGFSGHGFKLAPAVGELVRDQVMHGTAPLALFDPRRFAVAQSVAR